MSAAPAMSAAFTSVTNCLRGAEPSQSNVFLRILKGEAPADVVDADDPDLFTFRDRKPASTIHMLVIPRQFVRDAAELKPRDAELVRAMTTKARELVRAEVGDDAFDERELALGFHWPPFYSVPWLHLHAIYPRSQMRRRWKRTQGSGVGCAATWVWVRG